jgi:membrane protein
MSLTTRGRRAATRTREVTTAVVREVRAENVTFMAGSVAYHAFVSLLPFLLLTLFLLTRIGGEQLATTVVEALARNLTPADDATGGPAGSLASLLVEAARNATRSAGLSVVSLAALVWGVLRVFRGLDQAFSDIYETESANSFVDQLVDGTVVFGAIGLALFAVTLADAFLVVPSVGAADAVVGPLLSVGSIAVALLPMYYVFPDEPVTVREIVPGAVVAALGWTLLSYTFRLYAVTSSSSEYGIVGVVILLVTWLYFGGLVLLVGAAVNAVLAGRSEDVADIAWGGTDPAANDADFVAPLEEFEHMVDRRDRDADLVVTLGDETVTLPAPDDATVAVTTTERPALLGGNRERGEVVLRWDSRADRDGH